MKSLTVRGIAYGDSSRSKYGNKKTRFDGRVFDSAAEAKRAAELHLLEKAGAISGLEYQPKFPLIVNGLKIGSYIADFSYSEGGKRTVEDVKGVKTPVYRIKRKLVKALYGIDIVEVAA